MIRMLIIPIALFFSHTAFPCTFIHLGDAQSWVSAQNYDFLSNSNVGIFVNKRNLEKTTPNFSNMPGTRAKWISKYGSVSFGLFRERPAIGVNEEGLVIHRLLLTITKHPNEYLLPVVHEAQVLQYVLDTAQDLPEALQRLRDIQPHQTQPFQAHYVICDAKANCATIAYVEGQLKITEGAAVKVKTLTNTEYITALELFEKCPDANCEFESFSRWRFVKAASQVSKFNGPDLLAGVESILTSVRSPASDPMHTIWKATIQQSHKKNIFTVENIFSTNATVNLDFKNQDYSCKTPTQVILLNSENLNQPDPMVNYTKSIQEFLLVSLSKNAEKNYGPNYALTEEDINTFTNHPETYRCLE